MFATLFNLMHCVLLIMCENNEGIIFNLQYFHLINSQTIKDGIVLLKHLRLFTPKMSEWIWSFSMQESF